MNSEFIAMLDYLEREKGIKREILVEAVQNALLSAAKKAVEAGRDLRCEIDPKSGEIRAVAKLIVAERVTNWSRPGTLTAYVVPFYVSHGSDPALVRQVLLAAADKHQDVLRDPAPEVEFVEVGLGALRFQLQVWSSEHLKTAGTLRSDLNFEVWRQLGAAGVTMASGEGAITLGLHLTQSSPR